SAPVATVTDSGLAANTKYSYAFFAHDAVPNFATAAKLTYSVPAAPTVTLLSPNSGAAAGGTVVTMTGTNFTTASAVAFGGAPAAFTVLTATSISATSPAGSSTVDVTVTTTAGTSATSTQDRFTYNGAPPPPP